MALDTAHKRRIALGSASGQGRSTLDGAISTALERANVLGLYFAGSDDTVVALRAVVREHSRAVAREGR